jgi:hypothetical protein
MYNLKWPSSLEPVGNKSPVHGKWSGLLACDELNICFFFQKWISLVFLNNFRIETFFKNASFSNLKNVHV